MPAGSGWQGLHALRSIGSSLVAVGKSGLLGPYRPSQIARLAAALPGLHPTLGSAYRLAAAIDPGGTAAVDDAGVATFAEMEERAVALAAGLSDLGIAERATVGLLCRNHRGFVLAAVALAKLGADVVYLNSGFAGPQLADVIEAEGVTALVVDEEFLPLTEHQRRPVPTVVAWCDDPAVVGDRPTVAALLASDRAAVAPSARAGRQVLLTSGTTGRPKGAARDVPADPTPVLGVVSRIPYRRGDVTVLASPAFHAWGFANLAVGLAFGATLVLPRRFDPEDTLARIERYRARVLVAVPVMLARILELPGEVLERYDTSSLRVVALSGSALPGELASRFMDTFGEVIYNLYGSTEVGWVSVAAPGDLRRDPATAGRVLPGIDLRVLDAGGAEVAPGTTGRLFVRSALAFGGYTGGGGKEVVDGHLSTGDLGHLGADGLLFVEGRDDDMIVSGGENVFAGEVEDLLASHPGVVEAAVVGVPDEAFGQRLEAWVVLRDDAVAPDDLVALVRSELARYKVPRAVHVVDALPRNSTGKILKRELVAPGP